MCQIAAMGNKLKCFKAYDVRGNVPEDINPGLCRALGSALASIYAPANVALGRDARLSSPKIVQALAESLVSQGTNVVSLGVCGTEELYYAAASGEFDLGIMVTGSHNPVDENGLKFVTKGAIPVSSDSGLADVARLTAAFLETPAAPADACGTCVEKSLRENYIDWLLEYAGLTEIAGFRRLRVVADAGNGSAGPLLAGLARHLPVEMIILNSDPDGSFPNGVPNPLLPEKRKATAKAVRDCKADLGVAFDGDFDRCFFFDHKGRFIESCYLAGLLASELLIAHPDEKIIHDPRVYWSTRDMVLALGGIPVMSRAGHSYMKETMRQENAIYGAELSGHHFYRDFAFCDSGMLTMLLMLSLLMRSSQTLSGLVEAGMAAYPCSGEINFRVANAEQLMEAVWEKYKRDAVDSDRLDGISMEFPGWRFNLRSSNTEPLLRLNIESRGDAGLVREKLAELTGFIQN